MELIEPASHVQLQPGGLLFYSDPHLVETDVSELAVEYLCELAVLDEGVTLRDVLLLLKNNPPLLQVLRRFWAVELVEEAFAGESSSDTGADEPDEVEYLLLTRPCAVDLRTKAYEVMTRLGLVGIGFPQRDPGSNGNNVGDRQEWSMCGASVRTCLHYPLRLERTSKVFVHGRDRKAKAGRAIAMEEINFGPPTLLQILHSICYDLSFFGLGDRKSEVVDSLKSATFTEMTVGEFLATMQKLSGSAAPAVGSAKKTKKAKGKSR
ncbi:MAG: hypothetical protein V5B39_15360 [Accumulibacter sp.]|jgi:hypothetical protein|uniref:hypothetical protein n=1 Tax=Accumulibacter sp. TaxID=2053492 RepID=UPI002FC2F1B8